jgi:hypothetical protein
MKEDRMDQDKTQNKGMPDQALDASQAAGRAREDVASPSRGKTGESQTDYDQQVGDPNISVKQFTNDVEFIDNRGPLGAGD